jgi:hypothetical protein
MLVLGRYQLGRRPRGDLWSLDAAEVEREWSQLASDVFAVAHASYIAEVVAALLPPEQPEPHVLDVMVALWESLAEGGPSPAALRMVELELLDVAGHRPALESCAACGEVDLASGAVFDPTKCNGGGLDAGDSVSVGSLPGCEGGFPGIFDLSGNAEEWMDSCGQNPDGGVDDCQSFGSSYAEESGGDMDCNTGRTHPRDLVDSLIGFRCCSP